MVVMKIKGFQKKIMKNDPFDVIFVFQFLPHLVMASYDKTRKNILSLRKMYFSESSQGDLRKYYSYSQFFIENNFCRLASSVLMHVFKTDSQQLQVV